MSSISRIKPQVYTTQSKSSVITNLKMEIARINLQAERGLISQAEAQLKVAMLEAKISALESGQKVDGMQFETPVSMQAEPVAVGQPAETNNETPNENNDAEQRQDSFFEQQAVYNRMFHGI